MKAKVIIISLFVGAATAIVFAVSRKKEKHMRNFRFILKSREQANLKKSISVGFNLTALSLQAGVWTGEAS